jgi:signal transduction histidine kinase
MKILVVDDEVMQLNNMKIGLRTEGHSVVTAQSAEDALEKVKHSPAPFDLIIADYRMTGITGLNLLEVLRTKNPFIPVILMTAFGGKKLLIEALHHQCNGYIEKPFSLEQLLGEIERVRSQFLQAGSPHALSGCFSRIVHQINNPLAAIQGCAELTLSYETDSASMKQNMEVILAAADRIKEINRKIIRLGMAKEPENKREKVDVKWVLEDCLNMFECLITVKGISLEKKIAESDLHVLGDRFGLQQVFRNLILNAIEAMEGKAHKLLKVTAEMDEPASWVSVHIADTGCGVPEASGQAFFNSGQTTKENGSGLGLRVVKDITEQHKGKLRVSSREEHGTVITVSLPSSTVSVPGAWEHAVDARHRITEGNRSLQGKGG